jgi:cell fate regulator YaaT (PSP1 superfamily)
MSDTPESKPPRFKGKKLMLVRFGRMNSIGLFEHNEAQIPKADVQVVVKTRKGLELGRIVGALGCYKQGKYRWDPNQVAAYYMASEMEMMCEQGGKFIRYATHDDLGDAAHFKKIAKEEVRTCQRIVNENRVSMKIVDAEHILGGERVIFYFMSEGRVDFRDLVKTLSHEFQTRIEMRQIGARDEARLLGDVESCGQVVCCKQFLKYLKPVNMRMAKMQKATLDPAKISGYCGRLKCCLRYEDSTYGELKKKLPRKNTRVQLEDCEGRVIDGQILTQLILVESEKGDRVTIPLEQLEILAPDAPRRPEPEKEIKRSPSRDSGQRRGERRRPQSEEGDSQEPQGRSQPRQERSRPDRTKPRQDRPRPEGPQADASVSDPASQSDPAQDQGDADKTEKTEKSNRSRRGGRSRRRSGRRGRRSSNKDGGGDNASIGTQSKSSEGGP